MKRWIALGMAMVAVAASCQTRYSYADLVEKLTDLEALAMRPAAGETAKQWSSWDRASRINPATGQKENWDANGDGGGYIRREGDRVVMAEMEGPGVIWRIWSATAGKGHVKIYLDGAEQPAVDLPFEQYFDRTQEPFKFASMAYEAALGKNLYIPIPFQKSCKIVAERDWGLYYHFTYSTFPKGTELPTFTRQLDEASLAALREADRRMTAGLGQRPTSQGERRATRRITVPANGAAVIATIDGPRAITSLRVKSEFGDRAEEATALRELSLEATWDGAASPQVWTPLGDFFGTAPGANPYRSLPMGYIKPWLYSHWYMPFQRHARLQLRNDGAKPRTVTIELTHAPLKRPFDQLMYFHAKWHRDRFLPTDPARRIEWPILKTRGQGRYVGVMLHIWNPRGGWWGEGDEMFYVDGEPFPSTFGTGSEDYFGYAWCNPGLFQQAFHNQTYNGGDNFGNVSVNRWHVADNVPFQTQFEGTIEKYFGNERPTLYAAVAYWYMAPGGRDPYGFAPVEERLGYFDLKTSIFEVEGAIEAEGLNVTSATGGRVQRQEMGGFGGEWSRQAQVWWIGAKPGDRAEFDLPVEKAGQYELVMQFTQAPDYGLAQLYLDGRKLGEPVDLFAETVKPSGPKSFGVAPLKRGVNKLTVEIVGANDKAVKSFMFGLDYIKLNPPPK